MKKKKTITRVLSRAAIALTEGLFSHSVDLTLWLLVYLGELSIPFHTYGKTWRAACLADRFLNQINYDVIKNAIITAKKHGYIKTVQRHAWPQITKAGKLRLGSVVPQYDEKRTWDGRMHLVTYDIPEQQSDDRWLLREYLRRIGCGRLQDSVWMTPYNPIDTLRSFTVEHKLQGTIIVSDMGRDGSIGEEDVRAMIVRVYGLEALSERYKEWLDDADSHDLDQWSVVRFLSILKNDPQLPFVLLPPWWKGERAYKQTKDLLKNYVNLLSTVEKLT